MPASLNIQESVEDSLNRLIEIHRKYDNESPRIYPSDDEVGKVIDLFLSIIFDFADKNELRQKLTSLQNLLTLLISKCQKNENGINDKDKSASKLATNAIGEIPTIAQKSQQDIDLAFNEDPAVFSRDEIIKCYPFAKTVPVFRLANILDSDGVKILPRMLTEYMHSKTSIDIHPSATIDSPFFIDHGTGVVIGGTAVIGKYVKIFHGVTLGAKTFARDTDGMVVKGKKRHPTVNDNVSIYSGAVVLGGDTIIGENSVVGGNAWITNSIPKDTIILVDEKSLSYIHI